MAKISAAHWTGTGGVGEPASWRAGELASLRLGELETRRAKGRDGDRLRRADTCTMVVCASRNAAPICIGAHHCLWRRIEWASEFPFLPHSPLFFRPLLPTRHTLKLGGETQRACQARMASQEAKGPPAKRDTLAQSRGQTEGGRARQPGRVAPRQSSCVAPVCPF